MPEGDQTRIPAARVEITDPRTGLISREWYRFFFSLFNLTGGGQNQTTLDDIQVGPSGDTDSSSFAVLENQIQALAVQPPTTPQVSDDRYGVFSDTTTQSAAAINTAYAVTFNTTDMTHGVTIGSPTSRIYVDRPGIYNFQFSIQLNKASAAAKNVYIWYRKNGVDAANSATKVTLAGSSSATVAAWNFVLSMNYGDYFELMWSTDDTGCKIQSYTSTSPVPAIPSVILTVTDNIKG